LLLPSSQYKAGVEARSDNDYGSDIPRGRPDGIEVDRPEDGHWGQNGFGGGHSVGYESIGRSALHHPVLVGVIAVIGLLVGTAIGYKHPATYTADAQLIVGRASSLAEDQIPGLAVAEQELASDYARLGNSTDVISAAEAELHVASLPGTLSASPIAQSSIVDVQSTASSEGEAVKLANAGAAALETIVTQVTNDNSSELSPIVNAFQKADAEAQVASGQVTLLQHQLNTFLGELGNHPPTAADKSYEAYLNSQISAAQVKADTYKLESGNYSNEYYAAVPPLSAQQEMVQRIGVASYDGSNRKSYTEAAALLGAVGGLVVGLAAAAWLDSRGGWRGRRRARALAR
jgi:capsular polysaccharide biosynthesis protein